MSSATSSIRRRDLAAARPNRPPCVAELLEGRRLISAASAYVSGELLIGFEPGVSQKQIAAFYSEHGFSEREALDRYARGDTRRLKLVSVPAARTTQLIPALEADPRVAYAEPNYRIAITRTAAAPTDWLYGNQWNLNNTGQWSDGTPDADIDAPEAWEITTGSPDVLVAVIEGGVDYRQPDLVANMWTNPSETPGDGVDNDGNGYVDDVHGIDAYTDSGDWAPDWHATGVAGVLGATPYNEGSVGVAGRVGIINVGIFGPEGGTIADAVQGFEYVNHLKHVQGQNIVATNNSWGGYDPEVGASRALRDALAGANQPGMKPILHVCGAGNDNVDVDVDRFYPAAFEFDNVISVAATDWNDQYADFSNYGATTVDLAAPGHDWIHTTDTGGNRQNAVFGGTSGAAPHVTAAVALVYSVFPDLTAAQVKQRILGGVDPIGHIGSNSGKPTLTHGRLNLANALAGAPRERDGRAPAAVANLKAATADFHSITLNWTATGDDRAAGRAAYYDVRYATSPISGKKGWDAAVRVLGEPGPKTSGARETFTVSGLDPDTKYYFALKARDNMGNESGVSGPARGTTARALTLFSDDMENGANGWDGTGLWHRSKLRAHSPTTAWYYGDERTRNYETPAPASGTLTSPLIRLRGADHPVLIYREWREVEDTFESATVQVQARGGEWQTLTETTLSTAVDPLNWQHRLAELGFVGHASSPFSTPQWVSRAVDLSAFAGETIRIRFGFDPHDEFFPHSPLNDFEGWYVDDVNVFAASAPAVSASAAPVPRSFFAEAPRVGDGTRSAWSLVESTDEEDVLGRA